MTGHAPMGNHALCTSLTCHLHICSGQSGPGPILPGLQSILGGLGLNLAGFGSILDLFSPDLGYFLGYGPGSARICVHFQIKVTKDNRLRF